MRELAVAVRTERKRLGLSQSALAKKAGVGRDWIIGLEKGKPTAEIGLVLRALRSLGLRVELGAASDNHLPGQLNLSDLLGEHPEER